MDGIIIDGLLLSKLIDSRFPLGRDDFIAQWDASGNGVNRSTVWRWTRGQLPKSGEDLLRLSAILDVDPLSLLTFDRGSKMELIDRLFMSYERNQWRRLGFFKEFFGRQKIWPPILTATNDSERTWHRQFFAHDPSKKSNFYAKLSLNGAQPADSLRPQVFHFAFRKTGGLSDHWLGYGYVTRVGSLVQLIQINGHTDSYTEENLSVPICVETFFGPSGAEFCIASLHPFSVAIGQDYSEDSSKVRFPG